jgi:hypothetical protein
MTRLYTWPFEDWDRLTLAAQTWIALQTMIQEAFQQRLKATAPTAGHQGYAPAMPHQQNAFGILGQNKSDNNWVETVATQAAALTYQSQMTVSSTANASQRAEQQFAHLIPQQNMMHQNMHQIIAQVNALSFNQSDVGRGPVASNNFEGNGGCSRGRGRRPCGSQKIASNRGQSGTCSGLPRLMNSLPQTQTQEESVHMKACCRDGAPLVLGRWAHPRVSPM